MNPEERAALEAAQQRYRAERSQAKPEPPGHPTAAPASSPLTFWKVALAVFVGNILTGILAALVYAAAR